MSTEKKTTGHTASIEEQVAYLSGRVDTLEKLILRSHMEPVYEPQEEAEVSTPALDNLKRYEEMLEEERKREAEIKKAFTEQFKPLGD